MYGRTGTCDLIGDFLSCFSTNPSSKRYQFVKTKKEYRQSCDLSSAILPSEGLDVAHDLKSIIKAEKKWLLEYIKFDLQENRINVHLNRPLAYSRGLHIVHRLKDLFGSNDLFKGKVVHVKKLDSKDGTLTELRLERVVQVLQNVFKFCGSSNHSAIPNIELVVSKGSACSDGSVYVGPVICKETNIVADYEKSRKDDIKHMCQNKLDANIGIDDMDKLVHASLSFDLLQTNLTKQVTIRLGSNFVMYNYARLIHILAKYYQNVSLSVYPQLPKIEDTDFSLLILEDEWVIMYDYILWWPNVVRQSMEHVQGGRPKVHLIFQFLLSLAFHFSVFYNKTKILTDPRPHLVPLLHARIHLLLGLCQVYRNAFRLAGLNPLKQM